MTERELNAINKQSAEDLQKKEELKIALTKNEIDYREYCKELKQMAKETKEAELAKKIKEQQKAQNGGEELETTKPSRIKRGKIMKTAETHNNIEYLYAKARKMAGGDETDTLPLRSQVSGLETL